MPILQKEPDLYPANILDEAGSCAEDQRSWWALYTRSRQEKQLMRRLLAMEIPFYAPVIPRRYRSPAGRVRRSFVPLFANYVFILGDESQRHQSLTSNCVSRTIPIPDTAQFTSDLCQIYRMIELDRPLTPGARLIQGDRVRVMSGNFKGFEGLVIRRRNKWRLLIAVDFMQQGASVLLDDCQMERL